MTKMAEFGFDKSKRQLARKLAGYAPSLYPVIDAKKTERAITKNEEFQEIMKKKDITKERLAEEMKRLAFNSMSPIRPSMPDNEVRRRTVGMGIGIYGGFPDKRIDIHQQSAHIDLTVEDLKSLEEYNKEKIIEGEIIEEEDLETL